MSTLSAADRKQMSSKEFAGPGKSFPVNDANHARLAISGATRSEHAGNISKSEEDAIKEKARAKLGDKAGDPSDHKAAVAKMHPEHVHKLVQDAHAGKYGPQAQQVAQQATQPQADSSTSGPSSGGTEYSSIFSGGSSPAAGSAPAASAPANRAAMFGSSRGGK